MGLAHRNQPLLAATGAPARRGLWSALRLPLGVVALACLATASPALAAAWQLDRAAIAEGQLWRLFTCHLTHWNADHLGWGAITFLALGAACMHRSPRRTAACLAGSCLVISATVLVVHPELPTYRGLSGLDTALFTLLAAAVGRNAHRNGDRALRAAMIWAIGGFLAKTAYEVVMGDTLFVDSHAAGFVPLASAHVAGAVVGIIGALTPMPAALRANPPSLPERPSQSSRSGAPILPLRGTPTRRFQARFPSAT
jgi:rhomboid family GlyGly-CTERM serine protease